MRIAGIARATTVAIIDPPTLLSVTGYKRTHLSEILHRFDHSASPLAPGVQRYSDSALLLALCSSHSVGLDLRTLYSVERSTFLKFFCENVSESP